MKLITCSHIGTRPQSEFVFGGTVRPLRDPDCLDEPQWGEHVFHWDGAPGVRREWWFHTPTGLWFVLERDTTTGVVIREVEFHGPPGGRSLE